MINNSDLEKIMAASPLKEAIKEGEIHLKGYIFDSLVYRYQLALYKAILYDHRNEPMRSEDFQCVYNSYLRRFIEILNEAMGEHD